MKIKLFFSFIGLFMLAQWAWSQDIIIMKDGEELVAKVEEITPEFVKYRPYSNLEGPLVSIDRKTVFMIKYQNGSKEVMNPTEAEKPKETPVETPKETPNATDNTGNGPTVTYSRVEYHRKKVDREIYNQLKLNLGAILFGEIPISYERRLGDHISAEFGLGMTYPVEILTLTTNLGSLSGNPSLGYSTKAAFHFFPSRNVAALDEWYFGPEVGFKHFAASTTECGNVTLPDKITGSLNMLDFRISGGYMTYVADAVLFDLFAGVGMRYRTLTDTQCVWDGSTYVGTRKPTVSELVPGISLGVKFGFGW